MFSKVGWLAVVSGVALIASNQALVAQAASSAPILLDTISVTANKREQAIDKIDGGVSVATAEELREKNVRNVDDLQKVFPGLVINSRGTNVYANFTIRGMSSPDYYSPSVQVYVDGVPQAPSAMVQNLDNVERVEFLRGPQGSLYGRNAFGGVINIITRKPRESTATVFGTAANRLFETGASATAALIPETLFFDLSVKGTNRVGQLKDSNGNNNHIDGSRDFFGRVGLRYAPLGGPFDANIWVSRDHLRSREENAVLDSDVGNRIYRSPILGPYNELTRDTTNTGLSWNYRFGDMTLSSTTSFQDVDLKRKLFGSQFPETDRNFYQELKLAYDGGGPLKGVAGASYWNDWFTRNAMPGTPYGSHNEVESRSAALFGELTYALTDRLDLTAGARGAYDWSSINFKGLDFATFAPMSFRETASFNSFQPKVSLGYQLTDQVRLYGLISEGYKAGGFNHAVSFAADALPYKPETAWNYEVGARTSLFGGLLTLSTALYHIDSRDKQIYVGPVGMQVIRNAGEARSQGIEVEATLKPTDRLSLTANAGFGRSEFTNFVDPLSGVNYTGNRVPFAPDVTANLSGRYRVDQHVLPGQLFLTSAMHMVSRSYFDEANSLSQGAFATYDAAAEFVFDKGPTLRIFAENLTDKVYRTHSYRYLGTTLSVVGQGRVIGASMRMQF